MSGSSGGGKRKISIPKNDFLSTKDSVKMSKKLFQFLSPKVRAGSEPDTVTLYILNKYCSFPLAL